MKHCWLVYNLKLTKKAFIYENGLDVSLQVCTDVLEIQKPRKKKKDICGEIGLQTLKFLKQSWEGKKRRKWFLKCRKCISLLQRAKKKIILSKRKCFQNF